MGIVRENLYDAVNLGLPILFLLISIGSFIWFAIEVRKKRLEFKSMATWFTLNILFTVIIIYILIISVLQFFGISNAANLFNLIAQYVFGMTLPNGKEWVILLILAFISYILIKTLRNSIKISKLNKRIDDLGKEVAILAGKVNKSASFSSKIATPKVTAKELKAELREKIKIARAKKRAEQKLNSISNDKIDKSQ